MQEISVFWLRAAAALYAIGLFHSIQVAIRRGHSIFRAAFGAFCVGVVLHLVAIVESSRGAQDFPPQGFHNSISLLAFLIAVLFLAVYWKNRYESLAVFMFPLVFVMTAFASLEAPVGRWSDPGTRGALLLVHIVIVLLGCSSLVLTALASVLYLIQERNLKRKKSMILLERLPPLGTIDGIISKSLGFGFVLITVGVVTGTTWAFIENGPAWVDPRVTAALISWVFCFVMVVLRVTAGWRGRKAAVMAVGVVACSAATWAIHYVRN
jgi:ABC-type uncharacterized transport system permease subunit